MVKLFKLGAFTENENIHTSSAQTGSQKQSFDTKKTALHLIATVGNTQNLIDYLIKS